MSKGFTIAQIEKLKADGKIRGYFMPKTSHSGQGKKATSSRKESHPAKDWMHEELMAWCQVRNTPLHEEYNFNPLRRWRADWCIEAYKILVEYEGLSAKKTGHTTSQGYTGNAEKYNSAQSLGWKVLRFTYLNYKDLITELNKNV